MVRLPAYASLRACSGFRVFADYQEFIRFKISRGWSLGLAPLLDSPFNASKTNNKFREYGGDIPGLYSDVLPNNDCVEHGVTGLTGNDVESWVGSIIYAADNPGLGRSISRSAMRYVREHYSHRAIAPSWLAVIRSVSLASAARGASRTLKLRFNYEVSLFTWSGCCGAPGQRGLRIVPFIGVGFMSSFVLILIAMV